MRPGCSRLAARAAVGLGCLVLTAAFPVAAAETPTRQVRLRTVDLSGSLPVDLRSPEGKSRWDLTGLSLGRSFVRSILETKDGLVLLDTVDSDDPGSVESFRAVYKDDGAPQTPPDTQNAGRWLLPDRYPETLRPGAREEIDFLEEGRAGTDRLHADLETVGIGWIHLPAGPREVVLQRIRLLREESGRRGFVLDRLIHRWVDARAGVVAEISRRGTTIEAAVVDRVLAGAATLKIYVNDLDTAPFTGIAYGWDRGTGTTVASLTPQAYPNLGALTAADTWDFSGNTSGVAENTSTGVTLIPTETCNINSCGYNPGGLHPNRILSREDKVTLSSGALSKTNAVTEREQRPADVTVWLRAGAQNEGVSGSLGTGESHFCYINDDGVARTQVPIWRFPHQDAIGWYMQPGDPAWSSTPFNCEQNLFNEVCGGGGLFSKIYTKACGTHTGTQSGQILKGGVVILPSGHTFNSLLVKTLADFCVWAFSGCAAGFQSDEVRTFVYLWQVPVIGTVTRLNTVQNAADGSTPTTLAETDFKFGLFPPLSMTVTGATDTTVSLAWDPGRDTHRISGYKVYWGPSSGSGTPYPFDSVRNPGQVSFAGTAATITGLLPGTTYFLTVTSLSDFRDPSTLVTTRYESLRYPTQVSGDPSFVYPVEVQGTTTGGTCIPTAEVTGVTVQHDPSPGGIKICWQPVSDPCLLGYRVLGANSPTAAANFSTAADTGTENCWIGDPAFFLVVARGTGGTGPWGAYGR